MNHWEILIGYGKDSKLNISNALAENAIRSFAVGRKNWLFSDAHKGVKDNAICYSLIETAQANGLDSYQYIRHVLEKSLMLKQLRISRSGCTGMLAYKADSLVFTVYFSLLRQL